MSEEKYVIDSAKFKTARSRAGYSVRSLAEQCNVSNSLIEKYEKGGAKIVKADLGKYLELLCVTEEDILALDTPALLNSLSRQWKCLLNCITEEFEVDRAYAHFFDCVEWYCAPYWDDFGKRLQQENGDTKEQSQRDKCRPSNNVYICTRIGNFKKSDLERLRTIEQAIWLYSLRKQEYAFELVEKDGHIFEFFVRQLPKIKEVITAIKNQAAETEKQGYNIDVEKLNGLYSHIDFVEKEAVAIVDAEKQKLNGGLFEPGDFSGDSDLAAYYEDIASELDVRLKR